MLKRLKVTNFGKHQSREIFFTDGLNTVVGPNEAGKSTIAVEAIGYAFFGTSMLRETIDDTVTKGEKVGSMKVELDYGDYFITRSKSSAAVTGPNGLKISGQAEVTQFFYDLFGIAKGSERSIAIAEQGDIQGILSARGNAKAVEFIESVAGFSQLDELVEKVKAKYPSGAKAALEAMIEQDQAALADEKARIMPDVALFDLEVKQTTDLLTQAQAARKEADAERTEVNTELVALRYQETSLRASVEREARLVAQLDIDKDSLSVLKQNCREVLQKHVEELRGRRDAHENLINTAASARALASAKSRVDALKPKEGVEIWDGTIDELVAESLSVGDKIKKLQKQRAEINVSLTNAKATLGISPICPTCGTDLSNRQEEAKRVAEAKVEELTAKLKEADEEISELSDLLADIRDISDEHTRIANTISSIKSLLNTPDEYIRIANPGEIPESYEWVGEEPVVPDDVAVAAARAELKMLGEKEVQLGKAETEIEQKQIAIDKTEKELTELREEIKRLDKADLTRIPELVASVERLTTNIKQADTDIEALQSAVTEANDALFQANQEIKRHEEAIARLEASIKEAQRRIDEDQDNAELMKEIRGARTKVINQVWNLLLETTAEYFSMVRGHECQIERTDKSFMIDGEKAGRLSGSTRDALGLAIRAATCEIFAPRVDFLLLDEVAAGMDPERTARAMAMVASLPIGQTVLCTHEGVSDTLANNVIEV